MSQGWYCRGNYMLKSLLGLKSQTKIIFGLILHVRLISNSGKKICSKNYTQITSKGYKQWNLIDNKTDNMAVRYQFINHKSIPALLCNVLCMKLHSSQD